MADDPDELRTGIRLGDELGDSGVRVWHLAVVGVLAVVLFGTFAWLGSNSYKDDAPARVVEPDCRTDEECRGGICAAGECKAVRGEEEMERAWERQQVLPTPEPSKGHRPGSPEWRACRARRQAYLDRCMPECNRSGKKGGEYDACLSACTRREFDTELPTCTEG